MFKFRVILSYILCASSVAGCGYLQRYTNKAPQKYIDPTFQPYIEDFIQNAKSRNVDSSGLTKVDEIKFGGDPQNEGDCEFGVSTTFSILSGNKDTYYRVITINKKKWDTWAEIGKKKIFYHEMGHCVYALGHNKQSVLSIMYPSPDLIVNPNWGAELDEFFQSAQENKAHWDDTSLPSD